MFSTKSHYQNIRWVANNRVKHNEMYGGISRQTTSTPQVYVNSNSQLLLLKEKQEESSSQFVFSVSQKDWTQNMQQTKYIIHSGPVYVEYQGGKEKLVYYRKEMEVNKLYQIRWLGEDFALRKTKQGTVQLVKLLD